VDELGIVSEFGREMLPLPFEDSARERTLNPAVPHPPKVFRQVPRSMQVVHVSDKLN
jgi:hypothetical protein